MTTYEFMQGFTYRKGPTFIDGWRVVEKYGDCGTFALTVAYKEADQSWIKLWFKVLTFQTTFWLVKSPSNTMLPRHVIVYIRGKGWADSTFPKSFHNSAEPHKKVLPLIFPWPLIRVAMGKLYSLFK